MDQILETIQAITMLVLMVGNLLEVGLRLQVGEAVAALLNAGVVALTLLWCFVLAPDLASCLRSFNFNTFSLHLNQGANIATPLREVKERPPRHLSALSFVSRSAAHGRGARLLCPSQDNFHIAEIDSS